MQSPPLNADRKSVCCQAAVYLAAPRPGRGDEHCCFKCGNICKLLPPAKIEANDDTKTQTQNPINMTTPNLDDLQKQLDAMQAELKKVEAENERLKAAAASHSSRKPALPGVGTVVRRHRENLGMSCQAFSKSLKKNPSYISQLETKPDSNPRFNDLKKVIDALQLTLVEFFTEVEEDLKKAAKAKTEEKEQPATA